MYTIIYVRNRQKSSVKDLSFSEAVWFIVDLERQGYDEFQIFDENNRLIMEDYADFDEEGYNLFWNS